MKTSVVFKQAKNLIAGSWKEYRDTPKNRYVCISLADLGLSARDYKRCDAIITNLLDPYGNLEAWVYSRPSVKVSARFMNSDAAFDKMQVTRHAWLDHLIEHYESIGD